MNSFFKKSRKIFLWILGVLVFLFVAGSLGQYYVPRVEEYFMNKRGEKIIADWEAKKKALEELERQDFVGGKTPEETMEMVIEALEDGDAKLASKYYVVNDQVKAENNFFEELNKYGNLLKSVEYYQSIKSFSSKKCGQDVDGDWCSFKYLFRFDKYSTSTSNISGKEIYFVNKPGDVGYKITEFVLNKYTKVWKLVF